MKTVVRLFAFESRCKGILVETMHNLTLYSILGILYARCTEATSGMVRI